MNWTSRAQAALFTAMKKAGVHPSQMDPFDMTTFPVAKWQRFSRVIRWMGRREGMLDDDGRLLPWPVVRDQSP